MTEFDEIVMNVVSAVRKGEMSQGEAAILLNDFQDHESEERKVRLHKAASRKRVNLFSIFSKLLGYVEYKAYIKSPEWRCKATAAKKRAGFRCQVCNKGPKDGVRLEAHHRDYKRLGRERPEDITVLCNKCHSLFSRSK